MTQKTSRLIATAFSCVACCVAALAGSLTTTGGESYDGEIYKVLDGVVFLESGDEKAELEIASLNAASQDAVAAWSAENPHAVDVYTKWDVQPRVKSTVMPYLPEQFHDPEFKGMVSVDLVLNESGQVIHAAIKKSTHPGLETPSLEAASTWIFEPAKVSGKNVKAKLRVPFKFVYTPPAPEEAPAG